MTTKYCPKCNTDKPASAFALNRSRKDGLQGHCRVCRCDPKYRAQDAKRKRETKDQRRASVVADARRLLADPVRAEARRKYAREYYRRRRHEGYQSIQDIARRAVRDALKRGELEKKPCRLCAGVSAEAHHEDYTKPLEVVWLCSPCHDEVHYQRRRGRDILNSRTETDR